jgi:hypothetical protein
LRADIFAAVTIITITVVAIILDAVKGTYSENELKNGWSTVFLVGVGGRRRRRRERRRMGVVRI